MSDDMGKPPSPPKKLRYDFVKSDHFRVVCADGAWGGLRPTGGIFMALFNERTPIPQQVTHSLEVEGERLRIGEEIRAERVRRSAAVLREVEVGIVMTADAAATIGKWLLEWSEKARKTAAEGAAPIEAPPENDASSD